MQRGGGASMGRNGYRRHDQRQQPEQRPSHAGTVGRGEHSPPSSMLHTGDHLPPPQVAISSLEKRLAGVQEEFTRALHKIGEKENEKFDLIFSILSELQNRQAELEESVRSIKAQYGVPSSAASSSGTQPPARRGGGSSGGASGGACGSSAGQQPNRQSQAQAASHFSSGPSSNSSHAYGQMNGHMQQQMQQFAGVMGTGGQAAVFTAVPQMMVVSSPTASGMQYGMPQLMSPTGSLQPMSPNGSMQPMAMQFMGQTPMQAVGNSSWTDEANAGGDAASSGPGCGTVEEADERAPKAPATDAAAAPPSQTAQVPPVSSTGGGGGGIRDGGGDARELANAPKAKSDEG